VSDAYLGYFERFIAERRLSRRSRASAIRKPARAS
jgi:hypothetical protein